MFICKEDVKTIFRRLDALETELSRQDGRVSKQAEFIKNQQKTCPHTKKNVMPNLGIKDQGYLVCTNCGATVASGDYKTLKKVLTYEQQQEAQVPHHD